MPNPIVLRRVVYTAPTAPAPGIVLGSFTAGVASGSDSGVSNSDGITNEPRPELSINDGTGWVIAGMRVQMRVNGGSPVALTDGDHHILTSEDFPGPWYLGYDEDLPEGATVELRIGKPDGSEYTDWEAISPLTLDYTAPSSPTLTPSDNATGVSASATPSLEFAENVYPGTGSITIKKTSDNSTVEAFNVATEQGTDPGEVEFTGDTVTLHPTSTLPSEELYIQVDSTAITDAAGNAYAGISSTTAWSFTVAAPSTPADDFLARTSLTAPTDNAYISAYTTLIDGLVTDGVWAKLDALYVFATKNKATALLNLVSATYNITESGSSTFSADAGITAASGSYLDSGYNAQSSGGNFVQDSAHLSVWVETNDPATSSVVGTSSGAGTNIFPRFSNSLYMRINDAVETGSVANFDSTGFYTVTRTGASTQKGYRNASDMSMPQTTSGTPPNGTIRYSDVNRQISFASIGGALTPTDVSNLHSRLGTFRSAI